MTDAEQLIETIRNNIIGADQGISGPFGPRRVTYADYTASGQSLAFIEDFILGEVLPYYANTHTESSGTGRQTTLFREDARRLIRDAVGGTDDDVVIFAGSGATGAINKLVDVLNIRIPANLDAEHRLSRHIPESARPVVFVGPYEHHSNELPWRESVADVVTIDEDEDGLIDLHVLERELVRFADRPVKIGSFSAASNVTGIGSKTAEIAILLHKHHALSFWDFAAAGPYVEIEMNLVGEGPDGHLAYKDAIFLSPHKFIGGPGTPGVLVAKRALFTNAVPTQPGGGTVLYVTETQWGYKPELEEREEGGTPAIIESIRAGLVFQLKQAVGHDAIASRERDFIDRAIQAWSANDNIQILGNKDAWRLSIVSFQIRALDRYLHHNAVVALLNDLFGIQSRGGCSCAGPYGHRLLGISDEMSRLFVKEILAGCEGVRPGWVRLNFNYFINEEIFRFLIDAVSWVANHGWKLLPLYDFDPDTGEWSYRGFEHSNVLRLSDLRYRHGKLSWRSRHSTEPEWAVEGYIEEADKLLRSLGLGEARDPELPVEVEAIRWFLLPTEAAAELRRQGLTVG